MLAVANLFVDGEETDAVFAAFGVGFGVDVFGVVAALAVDDDAVAYDAFVCEVEAVDAHTNLLLEVEEGEGFGWADDDGLLALVGSFGEEDL